jgi:hypothetical protein
MAEAREPVRGTYQHYKGAFYEVLGIAEDPETGQRSVVYQSLGISENLLDTEEAGPHLGRRVIRNGSKGALAVSSVSRFTERVDGKEYSGGKKVPRFKLISPMPPAD